MMSGVAYRTSSRVIGKKSRNPSRTDESAVVEKPKSPRKIFLIQRRYWMGAGSVSPYLRIMLSICSTVIFSCVT